MNPVSVRAGMRVVFERAFRTCRMLEIRWYAFLPWVKCTALGYFHPAKPSRPEEARMQPPTMKKPAVAQTILASSIFIDLVGFSKLPTHTQVLAKDRFNGSLRQALSELGEPNYWVRDLGDGALIICPNSPEHALFLALQVHQAFLSAGAGPALPQLQVRTGLNLGVVKTNVDLEGRANYLGDGINATQRVMDFAEPGQILVSRAFADAVAYLHADYATLFMAPQAKQDKHGRVHEVFALDYSAPMLARLNDEIKDSHAPVLLATPVASPPVSLTEHTVIIIRNWFIPFNAVLFIVGVVWTGLQRFGLSGSRAQLIGATVMAVGSVLWFTAHRVSSRWKISASSQRTGSAIGFLLVAVGSMVTTTAWISTYMKEQPAALSASPAAATLPDNASLAAGEELMPVTNAPPAPAAAPQPLKAVSPHHVKPSLPEARAAAVAAPTPKPRTPVSAESERSAVAPSATDRARCTDLLNKTALGASISTAEKLEITQSCR